MLDQRGSGAVTQVNHLVAHIHDYVCRPRGLYSALMRLQIRETSLTTGEWMCVD
jgi:hypothetical protein